MGDTEGDIDSEAITSTRNDVAQEVSETGKVPADSPKRKRQVETVEVARKRSRTELAESVRSSFFRAAQSLPDSDSSSEVLRHFRAAAGELHLAARLLELDENLQNANLAVLRSTGDAAKGDSKESSTTTSSASTAPEPRHVASSTQVPESVEAARLLQSQYVESQPQLTVDNDLDFDLGASREAE